MGSCLVSQGEPGIGIRGEKGATGQKGDKGDRGHLGLPVSTPDILSVHKCQNSLSSIFYVLYPVVKVSYSVLIILGIISLLQ